MNPLEEQLLKNLVSSYRDKGINVQRILDNPIFKDLSLEAKVKFLESNIEVLSKAPSFVIKKALPTAGMGAVSGLGAVGLASVLAGKSLALNPKALALGAAWGGLMGSTPALFSLAQGYKRDRDTQKAISENKFLRAIADRTLGSTPPVPGPNLRPILESATEKGYEVIRTHV